MHSWYLKGSHPADDPDNRNDDIWTGSDSDSETDIEALDAALTWLQRFWLNRNHEDDEIFLVLESDTGLELVKRLTGRRPGKSPDEWQRERAMQAGMAWGCAGYNDVMGY